MHYTEEAPSAPETPELSYERSCWESSGLIQTCFVLGPWFSAEDCGRRHQSRDPRKLRQKIKDNDQLYHIQISSDMASSRAFFGEKTARPQETQSYSSGQAKSRRTSLSRFPTRSSMQNKELEPRQLEKKLFQGPRSFLQDTSTCLTPLQVKLGASHHAVSSSLGKSSWKITTSTKFFLLAPKPPSRAFCTRKLLLSNSLSFCQLLVWSCGGRSTFLTSTSTPASTKAYSKIWTSACIGLSQPPPLSTDLFLWDGIGPFGCEFSLFSPLALVLEETENTQKTQKNNKQVPKKLNKTSRGLKQLKTTSIYFKGKVRCGMPNSSRKHLASESVFYVPCLQDNGAYNLSVAYTIAIESLLPVMLTLYGIRMLACIRSISFEHSRRITDICTFLTEGTSRDYKGWMCFYHQVSAYSLGKRAWNWQPACFALLCAG